MGTRDWGEIVSHPLYIDDFMRSGGYSSQRFWKISKFYSRIIIYKYVYTTGVLVQAPLCSIENKE